MKYINPLFYFLILLSSCSTNTSSKEIQVVDEAKDLQKTFKEVINGYWTQSTYLDDILKTKSPFKSQYKLESIVELVIDTSQITGDSLQVDAPGIHEGGDFVVYFRPGILKTSIPTNIKDYDTSTNFYEFGYEISNGVTTLIIFHYNKNKKLLNEIRYLKVPKNSEGALQYMVNKLLFSGTYKTADSSGKTISIQFTNDGSVKGFYDFRKYYLVTDFVAEPQNSVDEVCFDIQTKNQDCYAYKIKGDTINLYNVIENENSEQFGELKYQLIKQ